MKYRFFSNKLNRTKNKKMQLDLKYFRYTEYLSKVDFDRFNIILEEFYCSSIFQKLICHQRNILYKDSLAKIGIQ